MTDDRQAFYAATPHGEPIVLSGHTNYVISASYSPDGQHIVSASWDNTLRIWDVALGETIRTLEGVNAVAVLDETRVVSASDDHTLRVWDVSSGETMAVFALEAPLQAVAVTADGRTVIAGDFAGGVHFLDLDLP